MMMIITGSYFPKHDPMYICLDNELEATVGHAGALRTPAALATSRTNQSQEQRHDGTAHHAHDVAGTGKMGPSLTRPSSVVKTNPTAVADSKPGLHNAMDLTDLRGGRGKKVQIHLDPEEDISQGAGRHRRLRVEPVVGRAAEDLQVLAHQSDEVPRGAGFCLRPRTCTTSMPAVSVR